MSIIGSIIALLLSVGAILYVVRVDTGKKVIFGAIMVALVAPIIFGSISKISGDTNFGNIIPILLIIGIVYSFTRFKKRLNFTKNIKKRFSNNQTSLKRRIDRDDF